MARRALRRRLQGSLALLVVATAIAAAVPFVARRPVDEASAQAARAEEGIHAILRLSIAARDAYAHQAHVFILNDATHVDHYYETAQSMLRSLEGARTAVHGTKAAPLFAQIERDARALDDSFRTDVIPQVGGDRSLLLAPAENAIVRVERMQTVIDKVVRLFGEDLDAAHASLDGAMRRSRVMSGAVLFLAVLVALAGAFLVDRSLSLPLGRLEAATDALAGGNLKARVSEEIAKRNDELGSLATRFNAMADRLVEREARLLESERLAAVGRLAAGVAHEINNPLGVILGHARLLEKRLDEEGNKDVAPIVVEVKRCQEIVAGLLDLTRPPRLRTALVDLEELCTQTRDRLAAAPFADVRITRQGDASAEADGDKLRQLVTNLFVNATQAGASRIDVTIDGSAASVIWLSVVDDGTGLAADTAHRLFTPFFTTKPEGTGLGLAVSRAIAAAHGGELMHVDTAHGARFDLVLPRRAQEAA